MPAVYKPVPGQKSYPPVLSNLDDNETIHQRFVLVIGRAGPENVQFDGYISVEALGGDFPRQTFPVCDSHFKALVHLSPGLNKLVFTFHPPQWLIDEPYELESDASLEIQASYVPLINVPPLHLAVLVASDSPLVMDCPPEKSVTGGHSDLQACLKKFRMAAYMWQAFTAEEMRAKGLGRRSFRLDEVLQPDTLSQYDLYPTSSTTSFNSSSSSQATLRATAKIHLIRTPRTTAEIQHPDRAQQNPNGKLTGDIYGIFLDALTAYGGPFQVFEDDPNEVVVAGHILDSRWSKQEGFILGHAALGGNGGPYGKIHLGMFGSHTTWSWPRWVEEIAPCFLDASRVTERSGVANDANQCGTFWEACNIGQGAALHEAGHAMGCPHRSSGIMRRGYVEWNRSFMPKESFCDRTKSPGARPLPSPPSHRHPAPPQHPFPDPSHPPPNQFPLPGTPLKNHWHIADMLNFYHHPLYRQPGDTPLTPAEKRAALHVYASPSSITADSEAGIMVLEWGVEGVADPTYDEFIKDPKKKLEVKKSDIASRFADGEKGKKKISLKLLAANGKERFIKDVWEFMASTSVHVPLPGDGGERQPGKDIVLRKRGVLAGFEDAGKVWHWAVLLAGLDSDNRIVHATSITLYKGEWMDGVKVNFPHSYTLIGGPLKKANGNSHVLGGGEFKLDLAKGEKITKLRVVATTDRIDGVTAHTDKGRVGGKLTFEDENTVEAETLEPPEGYEIIGFFGHNLLDNSYCQNLEFGIITAPKGTVLPTSAYGMKELTNSDGQVAYNTHVDDDDDEELVVL